MIDKFENNRYYVMSGRGEKWSDFEGPFTFQLDAIDHLKQFINENYNFSPEMLKMVVVFYADHKLDLEKVDGKILNGEYLLSKLKR